eukprot:481066_1
MRCNPRYIDACDGICCVDDHKSTRRCYLRLCTNRRISNSFEKRPTCFVIERAAGWLRGDAMDGGEVCGIFPASFVKLEDGEPSKVQSKATPRVSPATGARTLSRSRSRRSMHSVSRLTADSSQSSQSATSTQKPERSRMSRIHTRQAAQTDEDESADSPNTSNILERLEILRKRFASLNTPESEKEKLQGEIMLLIRNSRLEEDGLMCPKTKRGSVADQKNTGVIELLDLHRKMSELFIEEDRISSWKRRSSSFFGRKSLLPDSVRKSP